MKIRLLPVLAAAWVCSIVHTQAFSLLGPYADWMTESIGYRQPNDIGGPMNINEEYRRNVPVVTYGFDKSFLDYFGTEGVKAVEGAFKILNDLPPASEMVLSDYPTDTRRFNSVAANQSLEDLKSVTLSILLEQLGLAEPTRYVFGLRRWDPIWLNYSWEENWPREFIDHYLLRRNFDPESLAATQLINDVLFTGTIVPSYWMGPDVIEFPVDPLSNAYPVAGKIWSLGQYYTGLTRDDVGGVRYLLRKDNVNFERLPAGTQTFPRTARGDWRPGVEKIKFMRQALNRRQNRFVPLSTFGIVDVVNHGLIKRQIVFRKTKKPDIIFSTADLGETNPQWIPFYTQTGTDRWINNSKKNTGSRTNLGPGVIQGTARITFHKLGEFVQSSGTTVSREGWAWGSFSESTNPIVAFPSTTTGNGTLTVQFRRVASEQSVTVYSNAQSWHLPVGFGEQALLQTSTNQVDWNTLTVVTNQGRVIEWVYSDDSLPQKFFRAIPAVSDSSSAASDSVQTAGSTALILRHP
ncbi:MAG TPA: hypothetical protein VFW05_02200 [Verrucomicrobiae bacterium]|nr:hypothetical protein [Verrucomicrobiae bacterium]